MAKRGRKQGSRKQTPAKAAPAHVRGLTPKQKRFVDEYLKDHNGAAAYQRAGYTATGNAAETGASRLRRNAQVKAAIAAAEEKRSERVQIDAQRIVEEIAGVALTDMTQVASWDDKTITLKSSAALPPHIAAAVASIEQTKHGVKVRLHNKGMALALLARYAGPHTQEEWDELVRIFATTIAFFVPAERLEEARNFVRQQLLDSGLMTGRLQVTS